MPLTRCSLSIHGALTEGVAENVSGKGREGNKEGKGTRGETSHHGVTYVTRVSAAPVEVEPRDDMMTGLAVIEGIDLDAEIPCDEDNEHGRPDPHAADYLTAYRCAECGRSRSFAVCRDAWHQTITVGVFCLGCDVEYDMPEVLDVYRIVEVLR
jgi:hypothetical protein